MNKETLQAQLQEADTATVSVTPEEARKVRTWVSLYLRRQGWKGSVHHDREAGTLTVTIGRRGPR